jgi:hypothetical protein
MYSLLKGHPVDPAPPDIDPDRFRENNFDRIRCPRCFWQPARSSRWSCACGGTPEPWFEACGTVWNTFDTRGRCPGCAHQWVWTSCLRCGAASPHEDWYDAPDETH